MGTLESINPQIQQTSVVKALETSLIDSDKLVVTGGSFSQVVTTIYNTSVGSFPGLDILRSAISMSAMHDSRERFPAPKCFPNTYIDIKETIVEWSTKPNQPAILCFTGEPKSGKSAIAHEIADTLSSRGTLAGSFFFERDKIQNDGDLFLTLAYQIAVNIPGMDNLVNKAVLRDPTIIGKRGETQLTKLILEPLFCLPSPETPFVVVVDEFDLCSQMVSQLEIICLISRASLMFGDTLRFLIFALRDTLDAVIGGNNFYWVGRYIPLDGKTPPTSPLCVSQLSDQFFDPCPSSADSIIKTHLWLSSSPVDETGPSSIRDQPQRRYSHRTTDRDISSSNVVTTSRKNPAGNSEIVPAGFHFSGSPMSIDLMWQSPHGFAGSPMVIDSLRSTPRHGGSPMVIDSAYSPQRYGVNAGLISYDAHRALSINEDEAKVLSISAEEAKKQKGIYNTNTFHEATFGEAANSQYDQGTREERQLTAFLKRHIRKTGY